MGRLQLAMGSVFDPAESSSSRVSRSRFGSRRTLLCLVLLAPILAPLLPAEAVGDEGTLGLSGDWLTRQGDDPRWASPVFDDSAWRSVPQPGTWDEQGHGGYDGVLWYRQELALDEEARALAVRGDLALTVGPVLFGGYEVFAGGRSVGRSRGESLALPFPMTEVFVLPADSVADDGSLLVALRVDRIGWAADREGRQAPVGAPMLLGHERTLRYRAALWWQAFLSESLPQLILAVVFALAAFYHLLLFQRRREQVAYLWFGLLSLAFSINTLFSSYWAYEITLRYDVVQRISDLSGHLAAFLVVQFLWPLLACPISKPLRAYQISHGVLAAFAGLWPSMAHVQVSSQARFLWLLPLLVLAAGLILREAWRGDPEARTIALGGLVLAGVETYVMLDHVVGLPWTAPAELPCLGFAAVLLSMGLSLSNRFHRIHAELDQLRRDLERKVRERTADLEAARDQAMAASRVKSQFLTNMSHEVRTPLNAVIGMSQLLLDSELSEGQRDYAETIVDSGEALLGLFEAILQFSEMETGAVEIARAPYQVREEVGCCVGSFAREAAAEPLKIDVVFDASVPTTVIGDVWRTRQVLANLLDNAVKFTERGEVAVRVSATPMDRDRSELRVSVRDSGIGIPEEELDRVFLAFHQVDGSLTRRHGGVGLGLAISKRLTELMGGRIWAESAPGEGSTFTFTTVVGRFPEDDPRRA